MFQSRKKANTYRNIVVFLALPAFLLFLLGITSVSVPVFVIAVVFSVISASLFDHYVTWSAGADGEEAAAKYLDLLDDSYHVIHDVVLPGMKGNIDHIVLGPNGIFVVETKNHKGFITCNGDSWRQLKIGRRGTSYFGNIGSPSKQVKRNAILLREFIQDNFKESFYVNGIVVFTNENAKLRITNPTVTVLKPQEICGFIQNFRSTRFINVKLEELAAKLNTYSYFS